MSSPGGSWAEAEVGVTLNWDNVEGELRDRLDSASRQAAVKVRKNFAALETSSRKSFDRMATAFGKSMQKMDTDAEKHTKSITKSWTVALTRMISITEVAVNRINAALKDIPNEIPIRIAVTQTGMEVADIRRLNTALSRLQQVGNVNSTVSVFSVGVSPEDLKNLASALRRVSKFTSTSITISVTVNGIEEVERLAVALRSLPRRTNVRVDADTNSASKMSKVLGKGAGLLGTIASLGGTALSAVGSLAKFGAIGGAAVVGIAGALPAVAALGAALGSVLVAGAGAAVAGIAAVAIAGATLKTAFSGVGDAMKNAFDPEKAEEFQKALAKLSPEAQRTVLAFQSLGKQFKDVVQQPVQDAFFAGLGPQIDGLSQHLVPLRDSMLTVADGFNEGAMSALKFTNSAQGAGMLKTLFAESGNMAANLGSALGNLVPGLIAVGTGASQVFGPMTDGLGGAARGLSDFLIKMQESGKMQEFFTKAVEIAKQLGAVLADVGGIISGVFSAAQGAGGNILGTLGQVLEKVNEFVNSDVGQSALGSFFTAMSQAVGAVLPVLMQLATIIGTQVAPIIAQLITSIAPMIGPVLDALSQGITALQPAIGPLVGLFSSIASAVAPILPVLGELIATFVELAGPILGALVEALSPIIQAIGGALITALNALMPIMEPIGKLFEVLSPIIAQIATIIGDVLAEAITGLMPVITTLATGFGEVLTALSPLLPIIGDALIQIIRTLAPIIQQQADLWIELVRAIIPILPPLVNVIGSLLPPLIELLGALLPPGLMVIQLFMKLVTALMPIVVWLANLIAKFAEVLAVIISFAASVITTVSKFVGDVVKWFGDLASGIGTKVGEAKDWVVNKFTEIVDWLKGLPASIASATSNMWDGIKDSFKSALNWLIDKWNAFKIPAVKIKGVQVTPEINFPDIQRLASGGLSRGPGGPTGDKIPSLLSDYEFVTRAKAVRQPGALGFLRAFNSGAITMKDLGGRLGGVSRFSEGGLAGGPEPYGLPAGSAGSGDIFPQWVHDLEAKFGLTASTYAGHQEKDGLNKGIDWGGPVANMQRFAEWLRDNKSQVEQVIWSNPETGDQIGVADGELVGPGTSQPGYYANDWADHTDHVHTRQSYAVGDSAQGSAPDINSTPSSASPSSTGASSTPIGSGIGSSGGADGSSGGASWGNSGGGSKFNSAAEAQKGGITVVWVENWPAMMGGAGGSSSASSDLGGSTAGPDAGLAGTTTTSTVDTIALVQNPDGTYSATDPEWDKLIKRESGGRADIVQGISDANSGGNEASGLFQIAKGTWAANGGESFAPTAGEATAEQQAEVAAKIFNEQGGSPWGSGAGQNYGREDEELLRAGIQKAGASVPVTPEGTVPVTVTDVAPAGTTQPSDTPSSPSLGATTPPAATAGPAVEDMPYGQARADAWAGQQDFAGQARDWATGAITGELGAFLEPIGADGLMKRAVDELIKWAQTQREQAPAQYQYAGTVNNYGMDANKTKSKATEGMTAVMETYRQG